MLTQGYDGAGIGPILQQAGVPKGSFYHHFASKDDFAAAVIETYAAHYEAMRAQRFADTALSPLARLSGHFEALAAEMADAFPHGGCLYGMLAQTAALRSPIIRETLLRAFQAWEAGLVRLLAEAQAAGEIAPGADLREIAVSVIDAYEGAIVRVKTEGDLAAFDRFCNRLPRLLAMPT
jgi:TetR/AcrR family transcriptional regulator, transcriptional repressor for nem operon